MNWYHSAQFPPCTNQICDEPYADWGRDKDSCLRARQGRECAAGKKKDKRFIEERSPGGFRTRKEINPGWDGCSVRLRSTLAPQIRTTRRRRGDAAADLSAAPGGVRLKSRVWRRGVKADG